MYILIYLAAGPDTGFFIRGGGLLEAVGSKFLKGGVRGTTPGKFLKLGPGDAFSCDLTDEIGLRKQEERPYIW